MAKVIRLHVHRGKMRRVQVSLTITVCETVPLAFCRTVFRDLLRDLGASRGAIASVAVSDAGQIPPPTRRAS